MKTSLLVSIASIACAAVSLAAEKEDTTAYQIFPKNLARQHLGTNLVQWDAAKKVFTPTQAAAAWLDDDVTTGWPLMAEKQYYLITLQRAELLTNFARSPRARRPAPSRSTARTPRPRRGTNPGCRC